MFNDTSNLNYLLDYIFGKCKKFKQCLEIRKNVGHTLTLMNYS